MTDAEKPEGDGSERRAHERRLTCVVAEVETEDKSSLALIRNVSEAGALLFIARDLAKDSEVELVIHTSSDPQGRKLNAHGTIVRRQALDPSRTDLWRYEIGVHFNEPLDIDEEELSAISDRLAKK